MAIATNLGVFMRFNGCPLFNGITEIERKNLIKCLNAREVKYNAGDEICSYNTESGVLGMILSGKAEVKKLDRDGNYSILEEISRFGVFSDSFAYTATDANAISVFAVEPCSVLIVKYTDIFKRCAKACAFHSVMVENLMKIIIAKTKTLSQRVEILSNKTIRDKILSYCSLLVKQTGSNTVVMPMSYTSLAQYLCVDRSALMRELKRLSESGILKVNKRNVTVLSLEYI